MRIKHCKCELHTGHEHWHGSSTGYGYHACDCDECRLWNSTRVKERFAPGTQAREQKNAKARQRSIDSGKVFPCERCGRLTYSKSGVCSTNPECRKYTMRERARAMRKFWVYGLSDNDFESMYRLQDGRCTICLRKREPSQMDVDHNHVTGQVRGLLCRRCNLGLGQFKDDPDLLRAAAEYLEAA